MVLYVLCENLNISKITFNAMLYLPFFSNRSDGGHYVCASKINNSFYLNDDSKSVKVIDLSSIKKRVSLLAIELS